MPVTLNVNGVGFDYPVQGDENWGTGATDWATAVTGGMLQKAGGSFVLTNTVDFGGSFGIISKTFTSRGANPATVGAVRLANAELFSWRNFANSADLSLAVNASDELTYNGTAIVPSSGIFPTTSGGTGLGSYTAGDTIYYASGTAFTKLAIGSANKIMTSTGSAPQWVTSLLTSQGGTGNTSYTAGDMNYYASGTAFTKLGIGAANTILSSTGSAPAWIARTAPTVQSFTSSSGTYTTPTSPRAPSYIRVRMVGGGGGGSGSGSATGGAATDGTATTFGTTLLSAGGGSHAVFADHGGSGGTSSLGSGPIGLALAGSTGSGYSFVTGITSTSIAGAPGGNSALGGGGPGGSDRAAGGAGQTNTGGGGGGGGGFLNGGSSGSGGGSGGFIDAIISSPAATYAYVVGAGGNAGPAGTSGFAGGAGAAGIIIVEEFYL